jgi:hypothetical protein
MSQHTLSLTAICYPSPRGPSKQQINKFDHWIQTQNSQPTLSVLEFAFPALFCFTLFLLARSFCFFGLFCAIASIVHQEDQAVKINRSCASGFRDCSCLVPFFHVQLLTILLYFSGYSLSFLGVLVVFSLEKFIFN